MIEWLLKDVVICQYEFIGCYVLIILFGVLGSIGWATLAIEIEPMKLKEYMANVLSEIRRNWFIKEEEKSNPLSNPGEKTIKS